MNIVCLHTLSQQKLSLNKLLDSKTITLKVCFIKALFFLTESRKRGRLY